MKTRRIAGIVVLLMISYVVGAQKTIHGEVRNGETGLPVTGATLASADSTSTLTDDKGKFTLATNAVTLKVTSIGFESTTYIVGSREHHIISLYPLSKEMDAVVVTGTMRAVKKLESPIAVEVYTPQFFKKKSHSQPF